MAPTSLVWAEVQAAGEDPRPRVAVHEGLDAADLVSCEGTVVLGARSQSLHLAEQVPRHRDQCDVLIGFRASASPRRKATQLPASSMGQKN